ncbi:MAG: hypothetical protein IT270_04955 [Saprospiraceae bacterium]|nr:hypothetical protein [Saprospiraceae bacterium]
MLVNITAIKSLNGGIRNDPQKLLMILKNNGNPPGIQAILCPENLSMVGW